jgi:membrane protein DedA with SNARE-associated domain
MVLEVASAGYAGLACAVLLGTLGLPLPLGVVLTAMGVVARQGHLHISLLFLCSVGAAIVGDNLGYVLGRYAPRLLPVPSRLLPGGRRTQALVHLVEYHGNLGLVIFLTRWSLTAPATIVNVLAGYRRYRWSTFAILDVVGQSLWVMLALAPGYLLGDNSQWGMAQALGGLMIAMLVVSLLCRRWLARKQRAAQDSTPEDGAAYPLAA